MKKEIKKILQDCAIDIGVYPAYNNEIPRTVLQDGWNKWQKDLKLDSDWDEEFKKGFVEAEKQYLSNLKLYNNWYESLNANKEIINELLLKNKINLMIIDEKVTITVDSSDLFAWGYSDFEIIEEKDLKNIVNAFKNGKWGIEKMLCKKHNMKPQYAIIKLMKESGEWDDEIKKLPDNKFNIETGWPNE